MIKKNIAVSDVKNSATENRNGRLRSVSGYIFKMPWNNEKLPVSIINVTTDKIANV
jgi:hypothetical protein